MKLVIGKPEPEGEKEPIVHLWLRKGAYTGTVQVVAQLADCPELGIWTLLSISKDGLQRIRRIAPDFGFPLDEDGRLQVRR